MTVEQQHRVLVLDGDMVPSLTICRSLRRRGCTVFLGSHTEQPIASYSNTVQSLFRYPNPLESPEQFVDWLAAHTLEHSYDLVIPVTERVVVPISRAREALGHVKIAIPAEESLEIALDKSRTLEIARQVGVPGPGGVYIQSLEDLEQHRGALGYPLVIKPARSIGSAERGASQLQVSYAFSEAEMEAGCVHALRFGPVLLQQYFSGVGVGIELIACNGEIAYAFQHLRLHEVPLTGGGSSLRKSVPVNPALLQASEKLIAAMQWNGVAMVEFKLNTQTGDFCLMEINGRFWGSLPLADAAGADFPSMLLDLELTGAVDPCPAYRENIVCRLLSRDLYWYEAILRRDADTRIVEIPSAGEVFRELGLFLSPKHRFDVQGMRDPIPGLIDIGRIMRAYSDRLGALLEEARFRSQQRKAWKEGEVQRKISVSRSILFMCYGNINRSALADILVRGYAEDSGISIASAGFHQEEGRTADPVMVEIAAEFDIDMKQLRSSCVTPAQIKDSDIIFVMEKSHYDKLIAVDNSVANKIYLLGAHHRNSKRPVEIADPYGLAREAYLACYNQIVEAVDHIKGAIALRGTE